MAVRFDATGESYTSTSSPPSGSAFTVTCWVKVSTDRNTWSAAWSSDSSTSNYSYLATDSDGVTMKWWTIVSGNERIITGPAMTVGTWYKFAAVCNGANATLYWGTASGALSSASAANWVTLATSTTFRIGVDPFTDEWLNGCVASVKHWSTNLTQAEIERELSQYAPERTTNLVRWHPFIANETTDYSGSARTLSGGTGTAREDGPPIPWHASSPRTVLPAASGNAPITLGQAVETSTATAVGRAKSRALGQASETDTATGLTRSKRLSIAQATESDTATALTRSKTRPLGQATEADTATAVSRTKARSIGQAAESDTATALTIAGQNVITLGQAVETSTAGALTRSKRLTLNQAAEADTASALARSKARVIGQATESDTAQGLTRAKQRALGQAHETDTAQPLTVTGSNVIVLGQAVESSSATSLTRSKRLNLAQATETDTAQALSRTKASIIGQATETSTATTLSRSKTLALQLATETDAALALILLGQEPPEEAFTADRVGTGWVAGEIATGWTPGGTSTGWHAGQLT